MVSLLESQKFGLTVSIFFREQTKFCIRLLVTIRSECPAVFCRLPTCFEYLGLSLLQILVHITWLVYSMAFLSFSLLRVFGDING